MRLFLHSYFDLGTSFGSGGTSYNRDVIRTNPMGEEIVVDLKKPVQIDNTERNVDLEWRRRAMELIFDPDIQHYYLLEPGKDEKQIDLKTELERQIERTHIELYQLSIYLDPES
jgi:hypothetical protein